MGKIIQMPAGRAVPCPDRRPNRCSDGRNLAAGTSHVVPAGQVFTVCRVVDQVCWWPLTQKVDPAWLTWPTQNDAQAQLDVGDLRGHPFWGC